MNEMTIFNNPEFGEIRTVTIDNEPWFIGKDVAKALGYSNTRDALAKHVMEEDKADVAIHDGSQNRTMTTINESGIYALIFGSKLESAKRFKHWVTSEVLPSIRKNGSYSTTGVATPNMVLALEDRIKEMEAKQSYSRLYNGRGCKVHQYNLKSTISCYKNDFIFE